MLKAGREMDMMVATKVMGHTLHKQKHVVLESTQLGSRPLRSYSKSIEDAWEVAEAMGITLIPIEGGSWFALIGPKEGWKSPAEFLACLQAGDFLRAGAAVTDSAPLSVCLAALNAIEKSLIVF